MSQSVHQFIAQTEAELLARFKRLDNELLSTAREIDAEIRAVLREIDSNGSHRAWAMGWARGFLTYATRGESQLGDLEELEELEVVPEPKKRKKPAAPAPEIADDLELALDDLEELETVLGPAPRNALPVLSQKEIDQMKLLMGK